MANRRELTFVISAIDRTDQVFRRMTTGISGFEQGVRRATAAASIAISAVTAATTATGLSFNAMQERTRLAFQFIVGSAPKGTKLMNDLMDMTRRTTASFQDMFQAAQLMLARGFSADTLVKDLKLLADAAQLLQSRGIDTSLNRITLALGQIRQSPILRAPELRQLTEAGVPAPRFVAEGLGISMAELQDQISRQDLQVTGRDAARFILEGMEREFSGFSEVAASTFSGAAAIAQRSFTERAGDFTAPLAVRFKAFLQDINATLNDADFAATVKEWGKAVDTFVGNFVRGFQRVVIPTFEWIISHQQVLIAAIAAIALAFARFHPVLTTLGLIVGALERIGALGDAAAEKTVPILREEQRKLQLELERMGATEQQGPESNARRVSILGQELPGWLSKPPPNILGMFGIGGGNEAGPIGDVTTDQKRYADITARMREIDKQIEEIFAAAAGPNIPERPPVPEEPPFDPDSGELAKKLRDWFQALEDAARDGVLSMDEVMRLNRTILDNELPLEQLNAAMAGVLEANAQVAAGYNNSAEEAFNFEKQTVRLARAMEIGGDAVAIVSERIARDLVDAIMAANQALFASPTVEEAQLDQQIAIVEEQRAIAALANRQLTAAMDRNIEILKENNDKASDVQNTLRDRIDGLNDTMQAVRDATERLVDSYEKEKQGLERFLRDLPRGQRGTERLVRGAAPDIDPTQIDHTIYELEDMIQAAKDAEKVQLDELEQQKEAIEGHIEQIDREIQARSDQIESIEQAKDRMTSQLDELAEKLRLQRDVMTAHNRVQEATLILADHRLILEREQNDRFDQLIDWTSQSTREFVTLTQQLAGQTNPAFERATTLMNQWSQAIVNSTNTAIPTLGSFASGGVVSQSGMARVHQGEVIAGVEQWRDLVTRFFPASAIQQALSIMQLESGGNPRAAKIDQYERSLGLFQINLNAHALTETQAYDPETNVSYAAKLFRDQGWRPWLNAAKKLGYLERGLWEVPAGGMMAQLHSNEMVIPADWAQRFRDNGGGSFGAGGASQTVNIYGNVYIGSGDVESSRNDNSAAALLLRSI